MTEPAGTRAALVPVDARRGYDTIVPYAIRDQGGVGYPDFAEWVLTAKFASEPAGAVVMTLMSGNETDAGSYIERAEGSGEVFEMNIKAADLSVFPLSAGPMPDRFYYEISATGPAFGTWPIVDGDFVVVKSL